MASLIAAYGLASFSLSIMHYVFVIFYIPLFLQVHCIESPYLYGVGAAPCCETHLNRDFSRASFFFK